MEDLDSLIDSRVPKTFDPQCSAHTPVLLSPTTLLADMSTTCSPTNSSYVPLPTNRLSLDIIVALRADPESVGTLLAQIGEFNARHHIRLALPAAQPALQNLSLIPGLELGKPRSSTICREEMDTRVITPLVGLGVRHQRLLQGRT